MSIDAALKREDVKLASALARGEGVKFSLIDSLRIDPVQEFAREELIRSRFERLLQRFQDGLLLERDIDLEKLTREIDEIIRLPKSSTLAPKEEDSNNRLTRLQRVDAMLKNLASTYLFVPSSPQRSSARDAILRELSSLSLRLSASGAPSKAVEARENEESQSTPQELNEAKVGESQQGGEGA